MNLSHVEIVREINCRNVEEKRNSVVVERLRDAGDRCAFAARQG